jgi:3-isopropylmalate/(R)-2-methylmalate dehydratase large subunit
VADENILELGRMVHNIKDVEGTPVTNAFLGSCASGDEDLRVAARILKGRKVHPKVLFNITPGSTDSMSRVDKEGVISTLLDAGCFVCAPGCGMCPGFYTPLAKNEVCITSSTTNLPGGGKRELKDTFRNLSRSGY